MTSDRLLNRTGIVFLVVVLVTGLLVPALNLFTAPGSALHVADYLMPLGGKYLAYALLAVALDLVWGYAGILSLGHGAFFALGGYAMGMYLMRQIGSRGVYGNPILPDFMVFLNYKELPWFWTGFDRFAVAAVMVVLVPGLLAYVFGWFAFRSRVTGVYLSIITQAMTYALLLAFFRNDMGFGGNNGLTDFKDILGAPIQAGTTRAALFCVTAFALAGGYLLCRAITVSKLGKVLVAIRDAESRTRFIGYRVESYKLFVWVVSAMLAGIAGALYITQVGIINPSEFAPANSIEAVIWVAVGGRGTLAGAALGAVLVNYAKTVLTGGSLTWIAAGYANLVAGVFEQLGSVSPSLAGFVTFLLAPVGFVPRLSSRFVTFLLAPENWPIILGLMFVTVTLLMPKGILGSLYAIGGFRRRRPAPEIVDSDGVVRPADEAGAVAPASAAPAPAE